MLLTIVLLGLHCLHAACYRAALHYMDHEARVPNQYLVAFDPHMNHSLDQHWQTIGTDLSLTPDFYHFLQPPGYFSKMDRKTLKLVRWDPQVIYVEADRFLSSHTKHVNTSSLSAKHVARHPSTDTVPILKRVNNWDLETEKNLYWNLHKISTGREDFWKVTEARGTPYRVVQDAGKGVDVYILSSGINIHLEEFGQRAQNGERVRGETAANFHNDHDPRDAFSDEEGDGTALAGIVGAKSLGVAPSTNLLNEKIRRLGQPATFSSATKAMGRVISRHDARKRKATSNGDPWFFRGSVVLIDIATSQFEETPRFLGALLQWASRLGITIIAPVGDEKYGEVVESIEVFPCNLVVVICVGGYKRDNSLYRSNKGPTVNYMAPAAGIATLDWRNNDKTVWTEGTSSAAAHVAGIAAIFISWLNLQNGGVEQYLAYNAWDPLEDFPQPGENWPAAERPHGNSNHLMANTGIAPDQDKGEYELFVGGGANPVRYAPQPQQPQQVYGTPMPTPAPQQDPGEDYGDDDCFEDPLSSPEEEQGGEAGIEPVYLKQADEPPISPPPPAQTTNVLTITTSGITWTTSPGSKIQANMLSSTLTLSY